MHWRSTRLWKFALSIAIIFFIADTGYAKLGGTYTIDGSASASATNYKNFYSAVSDMISGKRTDGGTANGPGVSAAVKFSAANGIYNEQIHISYISGSSATNTITIESASGDSSKVILDCGATATGNYTLWLDSISYVTIKKISLQRSVYGRVVVIGNTASDNILSNNRILGKLVYGGGTAGMELVYSDSSLMSNNVFLNNFMKWGFNAFYIEGNKSYQRGTIIKGNLADSVGGSGIIMKYQDSAIISKNYFKTFLANTSSFSGLGIWAYNCINGLTISKNRLFLNQADYGMYITSNKGGVNILNNVISFNHGHSSGDIALAAGYNDSLNVIYNSVMANALSGSMAAYFFYNTITDIRNNIFASIRGSGWAIGLDGTNYTSNNDYQSDGHYLGFVGTSWALDAKDWVKLQPADTQSVFANPKFIDNKTLRTNNILLYHAGSPASVAATDFNDSARSSTMPDIGAYEFSRPANDAGVEIIDSPGTNLCKTTNSVYVRIRNYGSNTLSSFTINWTVNGTAQSSYSWSGSLASGALSAPVNIGTYTFSSSSSYSLKIYTSLPNGVKDGDSTNDAQAYASLNFGLNGKYTIGGSSPDYSTFALATRDLDAKGLCGAVTFNVRNGSYKEHVSIDSTVNTSVANIILFQSENGDSSKVIITYPAGGGNILSLNNAANISFRKLSFIRSGSVDDGVINVSGNTHDISFSGCRIIGPKSTAPYFALVQCNGFFDKLHFLNNVMKHGELAFRTTSSYSGFLSGSIDIENNYIDSTVTAMNLNEVTDPNIIGNIINHSGGIECNYGRRGVISYNKINVPAGSSSPAGIYLGGNNLWAKTDTTLVYNNFVKTGSQSGIDLNTSDNTKVFYNNVLVTYSSAYSWAMLTFNSGYTPLHNAIYNNNFVHLGGGYAIGYDTTSVDSSGYNNLYSNGPFPVHNYTVYPGTSHNLKDFQASTGLEKNSLLGYPHYYSLNDLHVKSAVINGKALPLSFIKNDIDGQLRDTKHPDIGADEFNAASYNASILSIDSPGKNLCITISAVYATLADSGADTLKSVNIGWMVNGVAQTPYKWTGALAPGQKVSIKLGVYTFSGKNNPIKVYCYSPNGNKDTDPSNDTVYKANLKSGMSGHFTIGGASPDYSTISAAVTDLTMGGLCGAVIFDIRDGNYTEQFEIDSPANSSAINTVTFRSQSLDSSKVIVQYASGNKTKNYVALLNGASYITFNKLTLRRTGTSDYSSVIVIQKSANHNTFINCRIAGIAIPSTGTYNYSDVIYSPGDVDNYNSFINNHIQNGENGFNLTGNAGFYIPERGTLIKHNTIDGVYSAAIMLSCQDSAFIYDNNITDGGVWVKVSNRSRIELNKIVMKMGYGLVLTKLPGYSDTTDIINNFISLTAYNIGNLGMDIYAGNYNFYFNNIRVNGGICANFYNSYGAATVNLRNNNLVNTGGGTSIEYLPSASTSDYNNLFSTGKYLALYYTGSYVKNSAAALTGWIKGTGLDSHSVSVDPKYKSATDLHVSSVLINNKGIPIPGIQKDIDGDTRSKTSPDIGADEFTPPGDDAGIASIDTPGVNYCAGLNNIAVRLKNYGYDTLKSVTIEWAVNDTLQTSYKWKGILLPTKDTSIRLGTFTFRKSASYSLKVYTTLPNGSADAIPANDTAIKLNVKYALSGAYTIGGISPDYKTLTAAIKDLNTNGVCGATIFNMRDGTYKEQVSLDSVPGTSSTNTVTIQSQSNDSSKVTLSWPTSISSADNYTFAILKSGWITLREISLLRTGTNPYGDVLLLTKGSNNNAISHNYINTSSKSLSAYPTLINSVGGNDSNNAIRGNYLKYGEYGMNFSGNISGGDGNLAIEDNIIDSSSVGIELFYAGNAQIVRNAIHGISSAGTIGLYLSGIAHKLNILKNRIIIRGNGIAIEMSNTDKDTTLIANNFIVMNAKSSATGLYIYSGGQPVNIYHNNILISGPAGYCAYITPKNSTDFNVEDNNFISAGKGYAIAIASGYFNKIDYNNYQTAGAYLASNSGSNVTNLAGWKSATSQDAHSISVKPGYLSLYDLHTKARAIYQKGSYISSVPDDIDGEARSTSTPCIGADEFFLNTNDAGVATIITPKDSICASSATVSVSIKNFGTDTIKSFTVNWSVNGITQTAYSWKGSLSPKATSSPIGLGNYTFMTGISYLIKAWTENPNGSKDSFNANDTASYSSLKVLSNPSPSIGGPMLGCIGDTAAFSAKGLPGSKFTWLVKNNPIASGQGTGSIRVALNIAGGDSVSLLETTSAGCTAYTSTFPVSVNSPVSAHFKLNGKNASYNFIADDTTLAASSYTWDFGDSNSASGFKTGHTYTSLNTYTVRLTTNNMSCINSFDTTLKVYTGIIEENRKNLSLSIYPDPFSNEFAIDFSLPKDAYVKLTVYNMEGKMSRNISNNYRRAGCYNLKVTNIADDFKAGPYLLKMIVDDQVLTRLIIKLK